MNPSASAPSFTVFELVNEKRREIYVARTDVPLFGLVESFRRRTPPAIVHWDLDETRPVRSIEFGLTEEESRKFVENYVRCELPDGWRWLS